jgi:hypothetical protein
MPSTQTGALSLAKRTGSGAHLGARGDRQGKVVLRSDADRVP